MVNFDVIANKNNNSQPELAKILNPQYKILISGSE